MKTSRAAYWQNKELARRLVVERIAHFNTIYGVVIARISIRNQKTRWGSASKKGNLNFHHAIIHLPPELADLIIVHELCHLKEFSHSKKFWDLVALAVPNWRELRRKLRNIAKNPSLTIL